MGGPEFGLHTSINAQVFRKWCVTRGYMAFHQGVSLCWTGHAVSHLLSQKQPAHDPYPSSLVSDDSYDALMHMFDCMIVLGQHFPLRIRVGSFMRAVFHEGSHSSEGSFMKAVIHQRGLS